MPIGTTSDALDTSSRPTCPELAALPPLPVRHGRAVVSLSRAKATLDAGESLWTPLIMLGAAYAIAIPAFLTMWGIATLAGALAGNG
jgi:hypothetical protein